VITIAQRHGQTDRQTGGRLAVAIQRSAWHCTANTWRAWCWVFL